MIPGLRHDVTVLTEHRVRARTFATFNKRCCDGFPMPIIYEQRLGFSKVVACRLSLEGPQYCQCPLVLVAEVEDVPATPPMEPTRRFTGDIVTFSTNHNIACESEF